MQKSLKKVLSAVQARQAANSTTRRTPFKSGIKVEVKITFPQHLSIKHFKANVVRNVDPNDPWKAYQLPRRRIRRERIPSRGRVRSKENVINLFNLLF